MKRAPPANYGIQGSVNARNVAVGPRATINDVGLGQEIAELRTLIAQLPGNEARRAQGAVDTIETADRSSPEGRASIRAALAEVEGAAKSSVGIVEAAQKIIQIVAPLAALLL